MHAISDKQLPGIIGSGRAMVMYHSPRCGHCTVFMPEFERAANTLAASKNSIKMHTLDALAYGVAAGREGVTGYPTVYFYNEGVKSLYDGPRTERGLVDWVNSNSTSQRRLRRVPGGVGTKRLQSESVSKGLMFRVRSLFSGVDLKQ